MHQVSVGDMNSIFEVGIAISFIASITVTLRVWIADKYRRRLLEFNHICTLPLHSEIKSDVESSVLGCRDLLDRISRMSERRRFAYTLVNISIFCICFFALVLGALVNTLSMPAWLTLILSTLAILPLLVSVVDYLLKYRDFNVVKNRVKMIETQLGMATTT